MINDWSCEAVALRQTPDDVVGNGVEAVTLETEGSVLKFTWLLAKIGDKQSKKSNLFILLCF
jgi:hypothetical protein